MRGDKQTKFWADGDNTVRVLLVSSSEDHTPQPGFAEPGQWNFHVSQVTGPAAAAQRLANFPVDVIVLQPPSPMSWDGELASLRAYFDETAVMLLADDFTPDLSETLARHHVHACLLPKSAPPSLQAHLVALTAERARLARQLATQTRETQRRAHELEQTRRRFRDVIEHNADAILVVDRDGVIRFANRVATALFGRGQELTGTHFGFPIVLGETTELDLFHRDETRVVEMRVVESEWEEQPAYIASLRDITERKRAEEGARRLIREQAARATAEEAARRFRVQAEISTILSLPLDYASTLSTLARVCVTEIADWAIIYVVGERGRVQRAAVAHCDPAKGELARALQEQPIDPDGPHPVLEVLRSRTPVLVERMGADGLRAIAQDESHLELMQNLGVASYMMVPLVARDREIGAIGFIRSDAARPFSAEDLASSNDLAGRAALLVDNARLYNEAQVANQAKTNLLAVVSHDLRTPLNSIIGHANLLTLGIPDPLTEASLDRVERIRLGAMHLLFLIDQLLSFARLEAGREELRIQEVDANVIAREVAEVVEPIAQERDLAFIFEGSSGSLSISTDPDRLRQVLLNLVGNALKYTERGEVRLVCRPAAGGAVQFDVIDTGLGIRPDHLERIFEPFWQVNPNGRSTDGGAGLGLSLVRRIVELLGGDVTVESAVGQGSRFAVRLPGAIDSSPSQENS